MTTHFTSSPLALAGELQSPSVPRGSQGGQSPQRVSQFLEVNLRRHARTHTHSLLICISGDPCPTLCKGRMEHRQLTVLRLHSSALLKPPRI